jgi:hypothetical protein
MKRQRLGLGVRIGLVLGARVTTAFLIIKPLSLLVSISPNISNNYSRYYTLQQSPCDQPSARRPQSPAQVVCSWGIVSDLDDEAVVIGER